ncbi:MAG TPA: hypothetical protein VN781_01900 [Acidimicrobiales bacterium]|nr:hypothetical protein [Acidimicrobiales bacterium]
MELRLGDDEVAELRRLLTDTLRDLSSEIADTDNAEFRRNLRARRQLLERVHQELGTRP